MSKHEDVDYVEVPNKVSYKVKRRQILEKIKAIKQEADDDESAHIDEDFLREEFIRYVALHGGTLGRLAKLVLSTEKISFARWCG